ncbi:hypothetical protein DXA36_07490 [Eisenbergiella sp. OF01-20]|jgi:hypothetical protein|nr:hypothetical protein DXA36_07490 [Eisenbergiella sp. OF01-20]
MVTVSIPVVPHRRRGKATWILRGEALPDKFHFFYRENSTLPEKGGFLKENDENCGVLKRRQE